MKNSEIVQLTDKELQEKVEGEKAALVNLKLSHAVSPLDNPLKISEARKNVARLMTEVSKRKIESNKKS